MKAIHTLKRTLLLLLAGAFLATAWWTVDGGGDVLEGDGYTLSGTIGQPDAAVWQGNGYVLSGGFWGGAAAVEYAVYLPPTVLRNSP
jgi:hypothetical protein